MKKLARSIAFAVALAGITAPALVGLARADIVWKDLGGGRVRCEVQVRDNFGNPMCTPWSQLTRAYPNGVDPPPFIYENACLNLPLCGIVWRAQYNPTTGAVAPTIWSLGGATAGGLNTESIAADSLIGGVGLYTPGLALNGGSPPPDSVLSVAVNKSVSTQLTLTIHTGGLQVNGMGVNKNAKVNYTIGIYPDTTTANADVNFTGAGAVPGGFGNVHLQAGPQIGFAFTPSGFFTAGDWIVQQHVINGSPAQNYTVRPNGTITKVIPLPGGLTAANAVIFVRGDPPTQAVAGVTPGYSTVGLVFLALALMGIGYWAMRSRRRVLAA
jgi:hypothetical protein